MKKFMITSIVCLIVISCYKKQELDPGQVLSVKVSDTIMPADGNSWVLLTANIDPASTERTVRFITSLGTFRNNGTIKTDSSVTAVVDGTATLRLYSGKIIGLAMITVQINDPKYTVVKEVDLVNTQVYYPNESLAVTLSDTAIKATSGQTFCDIGALLKDGPKYAQMVFKATAGSFLGSSIDSGRTLILNTDASGYAKTRLLSAPKPGIVFITIKCDYSSVDTTIRFK